MNISVERQHLELIYAAAIEAVHPRRLMPRVLSLHDERLQIFDQIVPVDMFKKIYVISAGKAAVAMAFEAENTLGDLIADGVVVCRDLPEQPFKILRPIAAGHPLPDANSVFAAEETLKLAKATKQHDLLIVLLSGGASSLVTDLPPFCTLEDIHHVNNLLINSGASIQEINTVRKHLSQIKGGQLAKWCKATIANFVISDVVGNDLSVIGSGPTVPDNTSFADAIGVLEKFNLIKLMPKAVVDHLRKGANEIISDTPGSGDDAFTNRHNHIIGDIQVALKAAKEEAERLGYETHVEPELLSGNAETAAEVFINRLLVKKTGSSKQCCIAGGETTVNVTGNGVGGRNQHFALAGCIALKDGEDICLLAAGTDGIDGPTDAAGAVVDTHTYGIAQKINVSPEDYLKQNDSYTFFRLMDGHVKIGPTGTNVMDIVIAILWNNAQA